jgi:general secretion pathway protein C
MNEARFKSLWRRASVDAPHIVSAFLIAAIALEFGRMGLQVLRSVSPTAESGSRSFRAGGQPQSLDLGAIAAAHLFGTVGREAKGDAEDGTRESRANLALVGTIATDEPRQGLAIISNGSVAKVYSVGDALGGATLYSVYPDHVVLTRNGSLETLILPTTVLLARGRQLARAPSTPTVPQTKVFTDNLGRVVDKEPGLINRIMRTIDTHDNTGKMRGFLIYPVASGAPLKTLGLVPGDLITSIDGVSLDDLDKGRDALKSLEKSGHGTVTVERQNHPLTLALNMTDVVSSQEPQTTANELPEAHATADQTSQ